MIYKEFIRKITEAIERKKFTLKDVAKYANIDVSYLSRILSGKRNPPHKEEIIRKIAKYLDINEEELIFSAGKIPAKYQQYFSDTVNVSKIIQYLSATSIKDGTLQEKKSETKGKKVIPEVKHLVSTDTPDELL